MIKVIFICHGNICRSPMAQFVLQELVNKIGLSSEFKIRSAATSQEEIGNGVYPPVQRLLTNLGIDVSSKKARQITKADCNEYDYIIAMEEYNVKNLFFLHSSVLNKCKVFLLKDFTDTPGDIDDPWFTRQFDVTYNEVLEGCRCFLKTLNKEGKITLNDEQLKIIDEDL